MFDIREYVEGEILFEVAKESPVRLCGFVVYSRKHPHVSKVLRDEDYWRELDAISGVNWPIFAIRPVSPTGYYTRNESMNDEANETAVRMCLDIEENELPCFVCFIWDDKGELRKITHKIDDRTMATTHTDLRNLVTRVADAINAIKPEYAQSENVFRNVKETVEAYNTQTTFRSAMNSASWLIDMLRKLTKFA
jgi:hypothetical protein